MKFAYHNSDLKKADVIMFGVPDDSATSTTEARLGSKGGPSALRKASQKRCCFSGGSYEPEIGRFEKRFHDAGDIKKSQIASSLKKVNGIPCFIGGDHSITYQILKNMKNKISVVYLDAHPDASESKKPYFGSVISDLSKQKHIDLRSSIHIGARAATDEENFNLEEYGMKSIRPQHIEEIGLKELLSEIKKTVKNNIYMSIDLDVCDPAFAPGVSTPEPGGLTSRELIYIARNVAKLGLVGFDITELTPKYDIQGMTAHLAANLVMEISSNLP